MSAVPPIASELMLTRCAISGCEQSQQRVKLFDHLVGAGEKGRRDSEAESLRGRKVYDEVELGRLLDRDFAWLRPAQNLIDVVGSAPEQVREVWSIGHQATRFDVVPRPMHRR